MLSFLFAICTGPAPSIGILAHVIFFGQQPGQRRPPRIDRDRLGCNLGIARITGLWVETRAIRAAHRLKRQCKHYRVSERGFKIHVITVNPILVGLRRSIREKLLEIDFARLRELRQASTALRVHRGPRTRRDKNALVNRLEAHLEVDPLPCGNARKRLTEGLRGFDGALPFAHFAGATDDLANVLLIYAVAAHRNSLPRTAARPAQAGRLASR